ARRGAVTKLRSPSAARSRLATPRIGRAGSPSSVPPTRRASSPRGRAGMLLLLLRLLLVVHLDDFVGNVGFGVAVDDRRAGLLEDKQVAALLSDAFDHHCKFLVHPIQERLLLPLQLLFQVLG